MSAHAQGPTVCARRRSITTGTICVFAKPPRPGLVKTRLVPSLGEQRAAELAAAFLLDTWTAVGRVSWATRILATTDRDVMLPVQDDGVLWLQGEGDLGARIERILTRALQTTDIAIAIGADSPGMPARLLDDARAALADHDAVIGPTIDGGFYLLGLRTCPPGLLAGVPWSTAGTCEHTVAALAAHDLRPARLEPWFDVDEITDVERVRQLLAAGAIEAPATARALGVRPAVGQR